MLVLVLLRLTAMVSVVGAGVAQQLTAMEMAPALPVLVLLGRGLTEVALERKAAWLLAVVVAVERVAQVLLEWLAEMALEVLGVQALRP